MEAAHILEMMLASIIALCQAVDLRHLENTFHATIITTLWRSVEECGLEASLIKELVRNVEKLDPLSYVHEVSNASKVSLTLWGGYLLLLSVLPATRLTARSESLMLEY